MEEKLQELEGRIFTPVEPRRWPEYYALEFLFIHSRDLVQNIALPEANRYCDQPSRNNAIALLKKLEELGKIDSYNEFVLRLARNYCRQHHLTAPLD